MPMEGGSIPLERRMKGAPGPKGIGHSVRSWDARRSQPHTLRGRSRTSPPPRVCCPGRALVYASCCSHTSRRRTEGNTGMRSIWLPAVLRRWGCSRSGPSRASFKRRPAQAQRHGGNVCGDRADRGVHAGPHPVETMPRGYSSSHSQLQGRPRESATSATTSSPCSTKISGRRTLWHRRRWRSRSAVAKRARASRSTELGKCLLRARHGGRMASGAEPASGAGRLMPCACVR